MKIQGHKRTFLPPLELTRRLLAWGPAASFQGRSLTFLESGLPVAWLEVAPGVLSELFAGAERGQYPEALLVRAHEVNPGECKLILEWPEDPPGSRYGATGEFHLVVRAVRPDPAQEVRLSVERLRLVVGAQQWEGAAEDLADLAAARLRWVGSVPPDTRAVLEVASMAAGLEFEPDERLKADLYRGFHEEEARTLSRRFLRKQFRKIALGRRPSQGFLCLDAVGALEWFLPELAAGRGLNQNRYHKYDIFYHSIYACDGVPEPDLVLRLAALCHDFGKVDTRRPADNGEATFHNHEVVSTKHVFNIMKRFGFEPFVAKRVRFLVRNHMFHYTSEWSDRAIRRFMRRVSADVLQDLIRLRLADREGSGKRTALPRAIQDLQRHIDDVRREENEFKIRNLNLNGHDLMELGMKPGRQMGDLLGALVERVKSGELANEPELLKEAARQWLALRGSMDRQPEGAAR